MTVCGNIVSHTHQTTERGREDGKLKVREHARKTEGEGGCHKVPSFASEGDASNDVTEGARDGKEWSRITACP